VTDRESGWADVGEEGPVVRDRRRFDPATGERRPEAQPKADEPVIDPASFADLTGAGATPPGGVESELAERTADLQRVQAEYANYRRRVERDRQAVGEAALASVMVGLLPVLDDIDRARAHGEVTGGFGLVADGLEATLTKLGLSRFGETGEPFDPTVHEALTHGYSAEVSEPVCSEVYQAGYRVGERVLRPARVAVLEPEAAASGEADASAEPPAEE
jgi:molecular chaperone GrpE